MSVWFKVEHYVGNLPTTINIYTNIVIIVMKAQRSVSIDQEIHEAFKKRPDLNVSAIVNRYLKEYLEEIKKHE